MNARYQLLAPIAQGGLGAVFRARDLQMGREVAVKRVLAAKTGGCGAAADALIREARQQSLLHHPNIAAVYDFGVDAEGAFIVMELISGETLEDTVARAPLPIPDFDALVRQTLAGVAAAHAQGILHLDLKPGNLMLHRLPDGGLEIKILDFGLARNTRQPARRAAPARRELPGSIHFMAPEQFEQHAPVDVRTDIYALGCIFYYALTRRHPFEGELTPQVIVAHLHHRTQPLASLRPGLPAHTLQWVEWLIRRLPAGRPASVAEALQVYESGAPVPGATA
ncbi:serine/threonine-protein kinase [Prosthecobacter sp.]|uniref:serine/threonine-protein kinase n=1 Tax=Prosthecobacter sp. TaxID=1965333 RepID=UPI0037838C94